MLPEGSSLMKTNLSLIFIFLAVYCSSSNISINKSPVFMNDGINVSSCSNENVDAKIINTLISKIKSGQYINIHSLLIAKNNKLIVEEYFDGYDPNKKHLLKSLGKSITSTLIGVAIDKGLIQNVDDNLIKYFPDYTGFPNIVGKGKIKLKHLLTMTAGLTCGPADSLNTCIPKIFLADDPIDAYFNLIKTYEPGTRWFYNDGNVMMLEKIIERTSGISIDQFEYSFLDSLLGISGRGNDIEWTSRDMLKLGLLYQNKGVWQGKQIVNSEWIKESTKTQFETERCWWGQEYGYFWWSKTYSVNNESYRCFYAFGNGGQFIFVFPEIELVVVFTGGNYNDNILMTQPLRTVETYILKSITNVFKYE